MKLDAFLTLDVLKCISLKPCCCHKAEKFSKIALAVVAISAGVVAVGSFIASAVLPLSITLTVASIATAALLVFTGIALFELARKKRKLPAAMQKLADNIHAGVIRTLCTIATAVKEKNVHLKQIYTRKNHLYKFQSLKA